MLDSAYQNPEINGVGARKVYIASRAVGGAAAAWGLNFLKGAVGLLPLTVAVPAISDHWAVRVGDYIYQLQSPSGYVSYERCDYSALGGWQLCEVGNTFLSDDGINDAANDAINSMPQEYHATDNNCQTFALALADRICLYRHRKLKTSYSPITPC